MNLEQAKAELLSRGYEESKIRYMKCRLDPDRGVHPVYEIKAGIDYTDENQTEAKIIDYKDPKLEKLNENEFWIPCAMDGYYSWQRSYCAPHWIEGEEAQKFCQERFKEKELWNHGEESENPTDWINETNSQFNAFNTPTNRIKASDRPALEAKLKEDARVGKSYLCKAIVLALKHAPAPHRVSYENLMGDSESDFCEGITDCLDDDITRIIEYAYRAGQVAERHNLHYNGIPLITKKGYITVKAQEQFTDNNKRQNSKELKKWQKLIKKLVEAEPNETDFYYMNKADMDVRPGNKRKIKGIRKPMTERNISRYIQTIRNSLNVE